jgi:hypothetical protein
VHQIHIQSFVAAARAGVWHALLHRTEVVLDALPEPRWPGLRVEVSPESLTVPWPHTASLGAERYFASGEIPSLPDSVWRSLTDPYALERWSDGVLDDADTLPVHAAAAGCRGGGDRIGVRPAPHPAGHTSRLGGVRRVRPRGVEALAATVRAAGPVSGVAGVPEGVPEGGRGSDPRGAGSGVRGTPLFRRGRLLYSLESSREAARGCFRRPRGSSRVHPSHPHKEDT